VSDQRNLLVALILSAIVLFGWSILSERLLPTANPRPQVYKGGEEIIQPTPGADPTGDSPAALRTRAQMLADTPRIPIRTPQLTGSINLVGARIDDLVLTRYNETIAESSPLIRLFSPSGAPGAYFASFGWTGASGGPDATTRWQAEGTELAPGRPVTLSWTSPAGVTYRIILSVDENYMFSVTQRVENRSTGAVAVNPYALVARSGPSKDQDSWTVHVGPMGVFDGRLYDIDWDEIQEPASGAMKFETSGGWLGFSDQYWLSALIADGSDPVDASFRHGTGDRFQADLSHTPQLLDAGRVTGVTTRLFAGAKEVELLDRYKEELGIPQFDKAIDWGWFYFLTKPIFYLLHWLFKMFGNFGVAIIGLTVIVRAALFPIANRQFASMAKMRAVTPKLKELQERHKDDKVQLQQAMLKLYQTEKINPLAGCLPIVLQIPVFYSLYKVLLLSIEMRHQPFVLWIKDLSAPDPMTPLNLFGLLPFQPPAFIAIGVLPLLLGVTMWLQQKLNPQPLDEVQKKVFGIMPWIFMFIMAPFAAGLQLYWTTNNLISIAQQWLLIRRYPVAPAAAPAK
jgi:YidC/Oxa1 family membrane protein insertase